MKDHKTALVHHWFFAMAGGERVCEAICELIDAPDLFSIVGDQGALSETLRRSTLQTSFVQQLPGARRWYRYYAWLFPLAVELFDLRSYDLVITSDASAVKGVLTSPETCHICYCHSPMRYAWNLFHEYRESPNPFKRQAVTLVMHYLRLWDYSAAARVDYFVANSQTVRRRIKKYYRRDARVIYPPCDVGRFRVEPQADDYYLVVGRLVDYKRADLAVRAFNGNGRRLLVVGDGPQRKHLQSIARPNVEFLGPVDDEQLAGIYSRCRALVFPGEEDFGIVPVEAQASGRPVIAFGKGGVLETVVHGETGILFPDQTPAALTGAVEQLERSGDAFDPAAIREHALHFSKERFLKDFGEYVEWCEDDHARGMGSR